MNSAAKTVSLSADETPSTLSRGRPRSIAKIAVISSHNNILADNLLLALRQLQFADECLKVDASDAANGIEQLVPGTSCIYLPSLADRGGMRPDLQEARRVFQQSPAFKCGRLVLISSALIYGTGANRSGLVNEKYSAPRNGGHQIPGDWLALEELSAQSIGDVARLTILRPTTISPSPTFLSKRLLRRLVLTLPGHDPTLQLLSVGDLAQAVRCAIEREKPGVFNVAPDGAVPLHQAVRKAGGFRFPLPRTLQRFIQPTENLEYVRYPWTISNLKIKNELGFLPGQSSVAALLDASNSGRRPAEEDSRFDEFGMDPDYIRFYGKTQYKFLSKYYWRIEDRGSEHVPRRGRALLVGMHRGFMPWDGVMALHLVVKRSGRIPRFLTHPGLLKFPFLANFMTKLGGVPACQESADFILGNDGLLGIFPEGIHGAFTPYREAYRLQEFGRDAFVKIALRNRAPIIPFVTVGSVEIFPILGRIKWRFLTRYAEWPCLPITPTFPLLPLPLPSKWHTRFLPPIHVEDHYPPEAAHDRATVKAISLQVRARMQQAVDEMLKRRRSIFFGSTFGPEAG
jgi:1-acyl-sn-glycerol-3-phosphate acyltransferase/nucleoside-diphosphate-sugar epimerase